jgi:hypothetical protein
LHHFTRDIVIFTYESQDVFLMCQLLTKENIMARSIKAKEKSPTRNKTSEAMSNIYDTKEVLVSSLTSSVLEGLTLKDVSVNDQVSKEVYNRINQGVTVQIDGLVNRLMKILD